MAGDNLSVDKAPETCLAPWRVPHIKLPLIVSLLPLRYLLHLHLLHFRRFGFAARDVQLVVPDTQVQDCLVDTRLGRQKNEVLNFNLVILAEASSRWSKLKDVEFIIKVFR